jgi:hypothetical protein
VNLRLSLSFRSAAEESAFMPLTASLDRIIGLDWSGRIDPAGQRRHIVAGVWTRAGRNGKPTITLESGRTREEVTEWLIALAKETPKLAVGIDLCFSFPAWFLREHGCSTVFKFWQKANSGLAEQWLLRQQPEETRDARFWGAPHKRPQVFSADSPQHRTQFRETDFDNKIRQALPGGDPGRAEKMIGITPKSPFQIGGSGSVGTGTLRGMKMLAALHDAGFRAWPFESSALNAKHPKPLLLEVYTRLMTGPVAKSNATARAAYLKHRRLHDAFYAALTPATVRKAAASEDALDALAVCIELVRHQSSLGKLRATQDPTLALEGITWQPELTR